MLVELEGTFVGARGQMGLEHVDECAEHPRGKHSGKALR